MLQIYMHACTTHCSYILYLVTYICSHTKDKSVLIFCSWKTGSYSLTLVFPGKNLLLDYSQQHTYLLDEIFLCAIFGLLTR